MKNEKTIGATFKKENIFLATVDYPMTPDEGYDFLEETGLNVFNIEEGETITVFDEPIFYNLIHLGGFIRQEFDIFYKDENGYTRFLMEKNETFAGDGSDGKGKLYNIVSAWEYYQEEQLCEVLNDKGEPIICNRTRAGWNSPIARYNKDYNLKSTKTC